MRFLSRDRWAVSRYPTSISIANRRRDFLVALDAPGEAWPEHMIRSRLRRPISAVYVIYDRHRSCLDIMCPTADSRVNWHRGQAVVSWIRVRWRQSLKVGFRLGTQQNRRHALEMVSRRGQGCA